MARAKIATVRVSTEARRVWWTFTDGTVQAISLDQLTDEMRDHAALHGLKQKGSDSYASAGAESEPEVWAQDQLKTTLEAILDGDWNRSGSVGGLMYEAIAAAMQQPLETILAVFNAMEKEAREKKLKEIRKHPAFKKEYTRLQADRMEKKAEKAAPLSIEF